jgi:hypothetical protein
VTVRGDVEATSLKADTLMVDEGHIVDASVDTLQIKGQAVTFPIGAYTSGNVGQSSYGTIQSLNIPSTGAPLIIGLSVGVSASSTGIQGKRAYVRLLINGAERIGTQYISAAALVGSTTGGNNVQGIYGYNTAGTLTFYVDNVGAGNVSVVVQGGAESHTATFYRRSLWAMEAKR